jgi:hypothetical protein
MARREQVHELNSRFCGSEFGTQKIIPLEQVIEFLEVPLRLTSTLIIP